MKKGILKKSLLLLMGLALVYGLAMFAGCGGGGGGGGTSGGGGGGGTTTTAPAIGDYVRTPVSAFRTSTDYIFAHGNASPDGATLYVAVNETSAGNGGTVAGMTGAFTGYLLKMSDVTGGTVTSASVQASNTISGMTAAGGTIAFRSSYTPDGTKIVQAGKDRVVVLNASTLASLNGAAGDTNIGGGSASFENHDALTIDNNYAILALQSHMTATTDSGVAAFVLYNLNTGAAVGNAVNACSSCHDSASGKNHFMCGIDGKLTKSGNTYTGTIYVATTAGGHVVKVPVTIDTTNTTNPITVGSQTRVQISSTPGTATDMPNFHDVRYDATANRVYYSAIVVDATGGANNGRAHMGYVDLSNDSKHDATIHALPAGTGLVYCGSGQTTDFFIPMTMSHPAYIDAVPKAALRTGAALNP